jgi:hypothetical protein
MIDMLLWEEVYTIGLLSKRHGMPLSVTLKEMGERRCDMAKPKAVSSCKILLDEKGKVVDVEVPRAKATWKPIGKSGPLTVLSMDVIEVMSTTRGI